VVDPAAQLIQLRVTLERSLGELEQPGTYHASLVPEVRDGVQVELAEVLLRLHDRETLRVRLEHAVLDAVMDHLDKMSGARRSDMQEPVARCECGEDGAPVVDCGLLPAGHEAVPDLEAPDAPAGSRVDEADAALGAARSTRDRGVVVAVATVDDGVALLEQRLQRRHRVVGHLPARHHDPETAWLVERGDELIDAACRGRTKSLDGRTCR